MLLCNLAIINTVVICHLTNVAICHLIIVNTVVICH